MIITLCGSARFEAWFHAWNEALTLNGHCVFGLGAYPSLHKGAKDWYTAEQKLTLDAVHKLKIDASDAILVLNVFAYIGESTLSEIRHAEAKGKTRYFLESWGTGLGIGEMHFNVVRNAAARFGVYGCESPIDTWRARTDVYAPELLGPGGSAERIGALKALAPLKTLRGDEE